MTAIEIAAQVGITKSAVNKRIGLLGIKPKTEVFGRAGKQPDYDVAMLPREWQERIHKADTREPATTPEAGSSRAHQGGGASPGLPTVNAAALALPSSGQVPSTALVPSLFGVALPEAIEKQLGMIPEPEKQQQALSRFRVIEPFTRNGDWKKLRGQFVPGIGLVETKQDAIVWIARQNKIGARTLARWLAIFRADGLPGLIDRQRKDRGVQRTLSPQDRIDLTRLYLDAGSARAAQREFVRQTGRPVAYSAVRRFIGGLPRPVVARRRGAKYFNDTQLPYIQWDYNNMEPNDKWVFDHTQLDLFVNAWGRAVRPWLTAIMDMKARYIVGWCLSLQPDSMTIASALRMALVDWGVPQAVYLDNGKDFRSNYVSGKWHSHLLRQRQKLGRTDFDTRAKGILSQLGIRVIYATPFHPQAKSIERWFRTLHRQFDSSFKSYCGNKPSNRPETCQPLLDQHKADPDRSPLPKIQEVGLGLRLFLKAEYHATTHSGRGMFKRSPQEVHQPSDQRIDEGTANMLMLKHATRKINRGAVELFGHRYEHPQQGLFTHNEHQAEVAYDPHGHVLPDLQEVFVHCCGQVFRCRYLGQPETYDELQTRLRDRRRLKKAVESYILEIHRSASVVSAGERRQVAVAGLLPAEIDPRAKLRATVGTGENPHIDEAADMLAEEEAAQATDRNAEDADIRLPDYDTGLGEVFTSRTEADKCQPRNSTRES